MPTNHMRDIQSGVITKTNVIGLKKAINADIRRRHNLSTGCTSPNYTHAEVSALKEAVIKQEPRVNGALHESGLKLLRSKRYRKRLASVQDTIDTIVSFRLVGFDYVDNYHVTPIYRACGAERSFMFRNVPWQSGGDGPEII